MALSSSIIGPHQISHVLQQCTSDQTMPHNQITWHDSPHSKWDKYLQILAPFPLPFVSLQTTSLKGARYSEVIHENRGTPNAPSTYVDVFPYVGAALDVHLVKSLFCLSCLSTPVLSWGHYCFLEALLSCHVICDGALCWSVIKPIMPAWYMRMSQEMHALTSNTFAHAFKIGTRSVWSKMTLWRSHVSQSVPCFQSVKDQWTFYFHWWESIIVAIRKLVSLVMHETLGCI